MKLNIPNLETKGTPGGVIIHNAQKNIHGTMSSYYLLFINKLTQKIFTVMFSKNKNLEKLIKG
jgi:hypothetical protein